MQDKMTRFLLIEDNDDHAAIILRGLRASRATVIDRVSDGLQALAFLRREAGYSDRQRPDVILLDLKLPKLDGHEVLEAIKSDADLQTIPVVVLSTSNADSDRDRAYRGHANSYLVKPMDFLKFRQMIQDMNLYWGEWNQAAPLNGT
jgi:CheY-like chemotaxis protein